MSTPDAGGHSPADTADVHAEIAADVVVDARGLRCPIPVIRLAAAARDAAPGTMLSVLSTDPAARHDVPAWARMRGHAFVATDESAADDGTRVWSVTVRLGGAQ
ncbi:tRNA 2-thiouridine synthesizing protein A [Sediminihabitans luteus]|uniref:tRNA 2-thiouridine synthesizing protein A n=1 Tax=Sediminihabitans luteus TaxID=1138585 RepID=A0A2M9CQC2_9CELL|nr:sulfurtransferase TusA family protein [Sediminihabitans luteus]PJJ74038.1 tRNA 2-thiouridine synthesizing protein A [Sediminihabitans luteus]GII98047.1 hypothetical protein Slu03_04250 [Sediminihabitans luteus]